MDVDECAFGVHKCSLRVGMIVGQVVPGAAPSRNPVHETPFPPQLRPPTYAGGRAVEQPGKTRQVAKLFMTLPHLGHGSRRPD